MLFDKINGGMGEMDRTLVEFLSKDLLLCAIMYVRKLLFYPIKSPFKAVYKLPTSSNGYPCAYRFLLFVCNKHCAFTPTEHGMIVVRDIILGMNTRSRHHLYTTFSPEVKPDLT